MASYYWTNTTPTQTSDGFSEGYAQTQNALASKDRNWTQERLALWDQIRDRANMTNILTYEKAKAAHTPLRKYDPKTGQYYEEWPQTPTDYYGPGLDTPEAAIEENSRRWYNYMLSHPQIIRQPGNAIYQAPGYFGGVFGRGWES